MELEVEWPRQYDKEFSNSLFREKVLIVGSGKTATDIKDWDLSGWSLVTINHAYQIRDDWEFAGYAGDFPKDKRPQPTDKKWTFSHKDGPMLPTECLDKEYKRSYETALSQYGKKHTTMFFNASYWVLWFLRPKVIGYMGCDMNYDAVDGVKTHFYGQGVDMLKRGIPDPLKMINTQYKGDESVLQILFNEFKTDCEKANCTVVNFSKETGRLPYQKVEWPYQNL